MFEDEGEEYLREKCQVLKSTWDIIIARQAGFDDMQDDDRFSLICTRISQTFMMFLLTFQDLGRFSPPAELRLCNYVL